MEGTFSSICFTRVRLCGLKYLNNLNMCKRCWGKIGNTRFLIYVSILCESEASVISSVVLAKSNLFYIFACKGWRGQPSFRGEDVYRLMTVKGP